MDPNNPLSDREKALENQYIKEKEKQLAKAKAAKKNADQGQQSQHGTHPAK
ncbi:hypothetical protein F4805DRAFT_455326 [Annulohypoxylon moriforme]|nr:hypothetical protein F4805DRAFT_455326 [Annulohypoxylon moriforme]